MITTDSAVSDSSNNGGGLGGIEEPRGERRNQPQQSKQDDAPDDSHRPRRVQVRANVVLFLNQRLLDSDLREGLQRR